MKRLFRALKPQAVLTLVIVSIVLLGCSTPGQTASTPSTVEATAPAANSGQAADPYALATNTSVPVPQQNVPPTLAPTPAGVVPEPTAVATTPAETPITAASPTSPPLANPTFTPAVPVTGTLDLLRVNDLMDYQVGDRNGNLIGEVEDLIIETGTGGTGLVPYLVVSSTLNDDFLIPVPWSLVQVRTDWLAVLLPLEGTQLQSAPAFNEDFWPATLTAAWKADIDRFWQNPAQAGLPATPGLPSAAGTPSGYIPASDLFDMDLVDSRGIELGEIDDIAIDWQNSLPENGAAAGTFAYVIVDRGDALGLGGENIPVPWRLLRLNALQEIAQVNLQPQVLQAAPAFDDFTFPDLYKTPWAEELARYWQGIQ
jgi:sporulation protein YlmC with PRC-barrel domain